MIQGGPAVGYFQRIAVLLCYMLQNGSGSCELHSENEKDMLPEQHQMPILHKACQCVRKEASQYKLTSRI